MPETAKRVRARPTELIHGENGELWILASSEADALRFAQTYAPLDQVSVRFNGWMQNVGWDRDSYELKREFVQATGHSSWWETRGGQFDSLQETAKLRRCFSFDYRPHSGAPA